MEKCTYRSKEVKQINWNELKEKLSGEKIAVAIDVAKQNQYALLTNMDNSVSRLKAIDSDHTHLLNYAKPP